MKFLKKFEHSKNIRFDMFKKVFDISFKRKHKTIVETGTARGKIKFFFIKKYNWKDGMSTIMFADFAKYINGHLHTCDISKKNIDNSKKFTKFYSKYISYYVDDSILFLEKFTQPIDLLYLDSYDGHNPEKASNHQLKEIKVAVKKIHKNSLILLDDKGAKTNLSINFLSNNGFKIIHETDYQVLFDKI
jgi:hypothetical protein|tara:strand:+ start:114 stop:680 length:567 start_codon:yes stop_codon:yes gene_type:complete